MINGKKKSGIFFQLDKDILVKDNKIYNPDTCCLVPNEINSLFRTREKSSLKINGKYRVRFKQKHIKCVNSLKEKNKIENEEKEKYIKELAQKHYNLGNIKKQCYEVMMKYKI